jgi:hypothetical protein
MRDLETKLPEFEKRGVGVVAISSDSRDRGEKAKADWGLANLRVGYGFDLEAARGWGLYVSSGRGPTSAGVDEPALFFEPGLFLIRPDRTLYFASVQTMPLCAPPLRRRPVRHGFRDRHLIAFRGTNETGRSVGDTKAGSIEALIKSAVGH